MDFDSPPSLSLSPSPRTSVDLDDIDAYLPDPFAILNDARPNPAPALWPPSFSNSSTAISSDNYLHDMFNEPMRQDSISESSHSHLTHLPQPSLYRPPSEWAMGGGFDSNTAFSSSSNDYHSYQRRASYPYARHENENMGVHEYNNSQTHLPLSADPLALHHHAPLDESPRHYLDSPHSSLHDFDHSDSVKSESPLVVPTQHVLPPMPHIYRPSSSHSQASSNGYPGSQPVVHVMHTDDAASKETQYLRRRCNNCHTTEPPSWRRSTLNPGKIVCNKCGLYERTHLRPRPHRFDELRAGNRARRAATTSSINAKLSPKARPVGSPNFVKKEPRDYEMMQRHNIVRRPSNASIVSSASGNSDWDDSVSAYNSSTPSSTYSSPMMSSFSIPGMPRSASPTGARELDMPIRLPNAPLSDIASMQQTSPGTKSPMKSATSPYYPSITSDHSGRRYSQPDRRYTTGSAPIPPPMVASETGWHTVATDDREAKVEA